MHYLLVWSPSSGSPFFFPNFFTAITIKIATTMSPTTKPMIQ